MTSSSRTKAKVSPALLISADFLSSNGELRSWVLRVFVVTLAVLPLIPAFRGEFLWLDHAHIEAGLAYPEGGWLGAFTSGFAGTGYYRPLMTWSLLLDRALGWDAPGAHAQNFFWHALSALLTFEVGRRHRIERIAALLGVLFFAWHPATVLVGSAIAFRSEAMLTSGVLLTFLGVRDEKPVLASCGLVLAGLSKETGLFLGPASLIFSLNVVPAFEDRTFGNGRGARALSTLGLPFFAFLGAVLLRFIFAPEYRAVFAAATFSEALSLRGKVFAEAVTTVLLLREPRLSDAVVPGALTSPLPLLGLVLLVLAISCAFRVRGFFALGLLALVPLVQPFPLSRAWSPHYLYSALPFFGLALASILPRVGFVVWFGRAVLAWMALVSFTASGRYQNDETLFESALARDGRFSEAHFYLGESARRRRDFERARTEYELALASHDAYRSYLDEYATRYNLGIVDLELGRFSDARASFEQAAPLSGSERDSELARYHQALASVALGELRDALVRLNDSGRRPPGLPDSERLARALEVKLEEREALPLPRGPKR